MYVSLGELNLSVRYEMYHTRILFFERYVRTLTYSILAYAYPRALLDRHCLVGYGFSVIPKCTTSNGR